MKTMKTTILFLLLSLGLSGCGYSQTESSENAKEDVIAKRLKNIQTKAAKGDIEAQCWLAICYNIGLYGCEIDKPQARELYQKIAKHTDEKLAAVQYCKGICYYRSYGVDRNNDEAAKWFRKAADQKFAPAQDLLGACYENGHGVPKDSQKAVEWYRKAAEQGYADAEVSLGACYAEGEGVPKDLQKAVEWFRKAAEQGHANARATLGVCYAGGEGVPKDPQKAVEWYRKAAEQGYAMAQYLLAMCYAKGTGVPQNSTESSKWMYKAADQGHALAKEAVAMWETKDETLINILKTGKDIHGKKYNEEKLLEYIREKATEKGYSKRNFDIPLYMAAGNARDTNYSGFVLEGFAYDKGRYGYHGERIAIVKELIKAGADVNKGEEIHYDNGERKWMTPLYWAIDLGSEEIVEELIKAGADVNNGSVVFSKEGQKEVTVSPLYMAVARPSIVKLLIEAGADVENGFVDLSKMPEKEPESQDNDVLSMLIRSNSISRGKLRTESPLFAAIDCIPADKFDRGKAYNTKEETILETIEALIKAGADVSKGQVYETADGEKTRSPLYRAAATKYSDDNSGHLQTIKVLLKAGADVNMGEADRRNDTIYFDTPLERARGCFNNRKNGVIDELVNAGGEERIPKVELNQENVNRMDGGDKTPLCHAAEEGNLNKVKELISKGADVNLGYPALTAAARNGHLEVVKELIKQGADVNLGFPALTAAARNGHLEVVKELIKHGADVNWNVHDNDVYYGDSEWNYQNALTAAAREGHFEVVKELINNGAKINNGVFNMALRSGNVNLVKALFNSKRGEYVILELVPQINVYGGKLDVAVGEMKPLIQQKQEADKQRSLALKTAIEKNDINTLKKIIPRADVNQRFLESHVVRFIETRSGSDTESEAVRGKTLLHIAASDPNVKPEVVKCLLDLGADPTIPGAIPDPDAIASNKIYVVNRNAAINRTGASIRTHTENGERVTTANLYTSSGSFQREYKMVLPIDIASSPEKKALLEKAMKKSKK